MYFDNVDILVYVSTFFVVVVGTLLSVTLWRVLNILGYVERTLAYVDHVREILSHWEAIPMKLLDRVLESAFSSGKKGKK